MQRELEFAKHAFDNGIDAMAVYGDELRVHYWNATMAELSAIPAVRAVGKRLLELFPAIADGDVERTLLRAMDGEHAAAPAPFFAARDPAKAHGYEWLIHPLARDGRFIGGVLVARSTVARGALTHALAETEQRFRSMADSSPVMLWMADRDSMCSFFNSTWLEFSGRPLEQEIGVGWAEAVHPEDFEHCMNTYMRAFKAREPFEMEYRLRRHDGEYRWILDRGTPRHTPTGEFAGYIGSCVDITELKNAELEARSLADKLARANEAMTRLLHATSHDLREPLRTVISFADVLERRAASKLGDDEASYLARIRRGGLRMRELVTALNDLAELRQAEQLEPVDMKALVEDVVADLALRVQEAGADVEVGTFPTPTADRRGLRRVVQNLLSNALKFRRGDRVRVRVGGEQRGDELLFWVEDDGIGFEPEEGERLFEMFARLHPKDRYEGSGVGLALVRDVIQQHKGRVWAESTPGEGSRFSFALPLG